MNGAIPSPTAQLIALGCHFNARARGLHTDPFFPSNSTCQFCEYVQFSQCRSAWLGRTPIWTVTAPNPDEWLKGATSQRRAILTRLGTDDPRKSDRLSAGFVGGGGRWQLNLVAGGCADVWEATWEVGNPKAADQRLWRVNYFLVAEKANPRLPALQSLAALIPALKQTLSEILAFSEQHNLDHFSGCFRKAIDCLSMDDPFTLVCHGDLASHEALSLPARQVLAACQAAWVFGGMGSWNDMGFEGPDQSQYEKLSEDFYTMLTEAICVGANSSAALAGDDR